MKTLFSLFALLFVLAGSALAQIAPQDIKPDKLQKFLQDKALAAGGDLDMTPDGVRKLLKEFGVDEKELEGLDDPGVMGLLMQGLGLRRAAPFSKEALEGLEVPKGLQVEAFGKELMKRIETEGVEWDELRDMMVEFGADKDEMAAMKDEDLNDMVGQMMGNPPVSAEEKRIRTALREQFDELLEGHRPAVVQAYESTAGLFEGEVDEEDKYDENLLCHGIVIDARGFVLSKASELKDATNLVVNIQSNSHPATVVKTWEDQSAPSSPRRTTTAANPSASAWSPSPRAVSPTPTGPSSASDLPWPKTM